MALRFWGMLKGGPLDVRGDAGRRSSLANVQPWSAVTRRGANRSKIAARHKLALSSIAHSVVSPTHRGFGWLAVAIEQIGRYRQFAIAHRPAFESWTDCALSSACCSQDAADAFPLLAPND